MGSDATTYIAVSTQQSPTPTFPFGTMDKPTQPSQIYARALYSLGRGCPLWIPEPNNELPLEYLEDGVQIGDVGILRPDGSFGFVFNACCAADDPVNRNRVPEGFQPLAWDVRGCHGTDDIFPPGHPIFSGGAEVQELSVEGSASLPGIPVGGGVRVSIKFGTNRGAVIIPPKGVKSRDCESRRYFRDYAMQNGIGWYEFIRETLGMEIGNGSVYFITGFDKTECWENAIFSTSVKERSCELIVNTGGLVGFGGRISLSDSSRHASFSKRRSPPGNPYQNQALFIRGFRISVPHKFRSFLGGSAIEITSTYEASFKDALGKKRSGFPSKSGRTSSSSGSSDLKPDGEESPGGSSTCRNNDIQDELSDISWGSGSSSSDTSLEEEDIIPPSDLYHPLKAINDYILQSQNDIDLVVTHDKDWISLLNSQDAEMPDDTILLERLRALYRITVKEGCASLDPKSSQNETSVPLYVQSDIPFDSDPSQSDLSLIEQELAASELKSKRRSAMTHNVEENLALMLFPALTRVPKSDSDRPATDPLRFYRPEAGASRLSLLPTALSRLYIKDDISAQAPLLNITLSSLSFLDSTVQDEDNMFFPLYDIKTEGTLTEISRSDERDTNFKAASIAWLKPAVRVQFESGGRQRADLFLSLRHPRRFRIPGYAHALAWEAVGSSFHCVSASAKGPIAILEPARDLMTPKLKIYESPCGYNYNRMDVYKGVSFLLLDYLLVSALLLVTDTRLSRMPASRSASQRREPVYGKPTPKLTLSGSQSHDSTAGRQMAKIMFNKKEPLYRSRRSSTRTSSEHSLPNFVEISDKESDSSEVKNSEQGAEEAPAEVKIATAPRPPSRTPSPPAESTFYPVTAASVI